MRLSAYALNHCFGVGKIWLKKAEKGANMPRAILLSASQNVRKPIQTITRNKLTKRLIEIKSSD